MDVVFPLVDAYTERLHLYEDRVLIGQHNPSFTRDLHVMRVGAVWMIWYEPRVMPVQPHLPQLTEGSLLVHMVG